jgi:hypothetical protein
MSHQSIHSQRLERWLGKERVENISNRYKGWYGRPVKLLDCPGNVSICGDGSFIGSFSRGYFFSALDALEIALTKAARAPHGQLNAGFSSISDALARASQGNSQRTNWSCWS